MLFHYEGFFDLQLWNMRRFEIFILFLKTEEKELPGNLSDLLMKIVV